MPNLILRITDERFFLFSSYLGVFLDLSSEKALKYSRSYQNAEFYDEFNQLKMFPKKWPITVISPKLVFLTFGR
jgi:hypothetical protein